jgi:hypothetical protein
MSSDTNDLNLPNPLVPRTASPSKPPTSSLPLSQYNNELALILDKCEQKQEEEEKNKKRKATPSKKDQQPSLPTCEFCKMKECHKIKFGGYCVSRVFQYCDRKENKKGLDWITLSYVYNDVYKEIWRVCTYLDTDYFDPDDFILDIPECMSERSYKEVQEIVKCKIALNCVQLFFWDGAMKKAHNLDD